jgi:hypothetical protein
MAIDRPIVEPDRKVPDEELTVMAGRPFPIDQRNSIIHEQFRRPATPPTVPQSSVAWEALENLWRDRLAAEVFAGWPSKEEAGDTDPRLAFDRTQDGLRVRGFDYLSQPGVRLRFWMISEEREDPRKALTQPMTVDNRRVRFLVVDQAEWRSTWAPILQPTGTPRPIGTGDGTPAWVEAHSQLTAGTVLVILGPRGVGPSAWPADKDKGIRRRFLLLGQTLDGMRAWDVRRGIRASQVVLGYYWSEGMRAPGGSSRARSTPTRPENLPFVHARGDSETRMPPIYDPARVVFSASGEAASWLIAAIAVGRFPDGTIELRSPPVSIHDGPAYLNLETVLETPQAVGLLFPRRVVLRSTSPGALSWTRDLGALLGRPGWPEFE